MGKMETSAKKRRRKENIQKTVLSVIGIAGIIGLTMIAPNVFQAIPRLMGNKYKFGYRIRTVAGRLAQKGLVKFVQRDGKTYVEITPKGRDAVALELEKAALQMKVKKRWDKRYRLVMFDIPEKRKNARNRLRLLMRELGFLRLQDSVWVYPYDCEELIALIKLDMFLGGMVLYSIAEQIENDGWIKRHFHLR